MAYDNQQQKHQGNWSCGKCGTSITELPFEPNPDRLNQLKCFDCHKKERDSKSSGPKETHEGNWECAGCGKAITALPFKPQRTDGLKCIDCFKASKAV